MNHTARILIVAVLALLPLELSAQSAKSAVSSTTDDLKERFKNRPPAQNPVENPGKQGLGSASLLPGAPAVLKGDDFSGPEFLPPHLEAEGMQLLQHYGAITGTVKVTSGAGIARINLKPRPNHDSFPIVSLFLERIEGGKYLRIPLLTDFELKDDEEMKRDADIPRGTYRVTLGFYKSSKSDRTQLEVHGMKFESAADAATETK